MERHARLEQVFGQHRGLTAASMGIGLSGTALGQTPVSQLPRAARDGVVKTWSSLVKRNPTVPHTPSPRAVAEPGINLTKSQLKSIESLKQRIAEHEIKLAEYIKDPMKYDNQGLLKNAPNDAIRQKIIQSRIRHLEQEIRTFENNIQKITVELPQ